MQVDGLKRAKAALNECQAVVVGAGAGMGVDSGLPDFRGERGFWNAYPAYQHLGLSFVDLANPRWFKRDPELAWGFYGHRLSLYREIRPHHGFAILQELAGDRPMWVFTSNVDGQFQRAGYPVDQLVEVHGSIHHLQCSEPCHEEIWTATGEHLTVDPVSCRAADPLPTCPRCGAVARPNILMFGDWSFLGSRTEQQFGGYRQWLQELDLRRLVVVEMGAGSAVPTVRHHSEVLMRQGATLIRINPREPQGPEGVIELADGALTTLTALRDVET